jgi:hypothetical protein
MSCAIGCEEQRRSDCAVRFEFHNQRRTPHDCIHGPGRQLDVRARKRVCEHFARRTAYYCLLFDIQLSRKGFCLDAKLVAFGKEISYFGPIER